MKKVKITVLKTTLDRELAAAYGAKGLGPCPMLKEGRVFFADYAKPDGLCDEAWKAIYQYVFALAHGTDKEPFSYRDGLGTPGAAIDGAALVTPSPASSSGTAAVPAGRTPHTAERP